MADEGLFGLNELSDKLNASVGSGDTEMMTKAVGGSIQNWLQDSIFPLMIGVVIFVTVLAVFYGGFLYFTAYGDENRATTAKKSITYGFVGLFIALIAFTITSYVRQNLITKKAEEELYKNYSAPVTENAPFSTGAELLR